MLSINQAAVNRGAELLLVLTWRWLSSLSEKQQTTGAWVSWRNEWQPFHMDVGPSLGQQQTPCKLSSASDERASDEREAQATCGCVLRLEERASALGCFKNGKCRMNILRH